MLRTLADAGVTAAEAAPLLAVTVEPHTEHHQERPAGGADARDKGRLPQHVGELRQRVSLLEAVHHLAGGV